MLNSVSVLLALVIWFNDHTWLPFEIEEWDGTTERIRAIPFTRVFWESRGGMKGIATPRIPDTIIIEYEDGTRHCVSWGAFLSLLGVFPPPTHIEA